MGSGVDPTTPWWVCSVILTCKQRNVCDRARAEAVLGNEAEAKYEAVLARLVAGDYVCTAEGDICSPVVRCRTEEEARAVVNESGVERERTRIVYVGAV